MSLIRGPHDPDTFCLGAGHAFHYSGKVLHACNHRTSSSVASHHQHYYRYAAGYGLFQCYYYKNLIRINMDMSSSDDIIFMDIDMYIMSILTRNKISSYDIL